MTLNLIGAQSHVLANIDTCIFGSIGGISDELVSESKRLCWGGGSELSISKILATALAVVV